MKLDDIMNEWSKDCHIDNTDLANESLKIPKLHAKYYTMYSKENLLLNKSEHDHRRLYKIKTEYYSGKLSDVELTEHSWEPFNLKVIRQDMDIYLAADQDLINSLLKISLQREKVDALKDIVKSIHTRGFTISNAINFLKWSSGV